MQQSIITIAQPITLSLEPAAQSYSFDFMFIVRMMFYLLVVFKIIGLSFFRRRRFTLKERIYRKFLFANNQLLRSFTEEDKSIMETTLNNTIKNATVEWDQNNHKIRKTDKKVNFETEKNMYVPPREREEDKDVFLDIREEEQQLREIREEDFGVEPIDDHKRLFEDKKLQDEFVEREDLLGLNQQEIIETEDPKDAEAAQSLSEILTSNHIDKSIPIEPKYYLNDQVDQ